MVRQPLRYLPFTSGFLNIFGIVLVPPSHFKMCAGNQDEKNYEKTTMQDNLDDGHNINCLDRTKCTDIQL